MTQRTVAPYLRRWAREDREWKESRYCKHRDTREMGAITVVILLVSVICGAALWSEINHRDIDERMPLTAKDQARVMTRAETEWRQQRAIFIQRQAKNRDEVYRRLP